MLVPLWRDSAMSIKNYDSVGLCPNEKMKHHFSNHEIAKIFSEMAILYEMAGIQFKPRAYERAAQSVESLEESAYDLYAKRGEEALREIPGVGAGIAKHLKDLFSKGNFKEYELLRKKIPVDILGLTSVEGVGARTVQTLWEKLKIKNISDLERAIALRKLETLSGFGKKSQEKIARGIEFLKQTKGRIPLGFASPYVLQLFEALKRIPGVKRAAVAGSFRRRRETIGDIDILISADEKDAPYIMERFLALPHVAHVYGAGKTKTNVRLKSGIDADLRIVLPHSWGSALNYFTGSKSHNIALRKIAIGKGFKLNEYGLFKKGKRIAGETEEEIYEALGLAYIEPEFREMTGEIEAARSGKLPELVGFNDIKGDLQVQTNWTDGSASIEEMARAAEEVGLHYIAITDHTKGLAMTGGLDEKKILKQVKEIGALNKKYAAAGKKFRILTGSEVNIKKDGTLDINDNTLSKLDVVGASVHSHFDLPKEEQTKRVVRAIENPHVDIIFHPTGRVINKRKEIALDIDAVVRAAKRAGTILEINAYPDRLDLRDEYIRKCVDGGVLMSVNSDAHSQEHFKILEFGIAQARRGWAEKKDIINTLPLAEFLKKKKKKR